MLRNLFFYIIPGFKNKIFNTCSKNSPYPYPKSFRCIGKFIIGAFRVISIRTLHPKLYEFLFGQEFLEYFLI